MNTTDYLINGIFIFVVIRQARERRLDTRSLIIPLAMMFFVGHQYLQAIPTTGNDLGFISLLAVVGVTLGTVCGFARHVRAGADGVALARVGWLAGALLIAGIGSRMVFAFAVSNGGEQAVATFSIAHQISAAAWPVALVSMALCEVTARLAVVQIRGLRLRTPRSTHAIAASVAA